MVDGIEQGPGGLYSLCVFGAEDKSDDQVREVFEKFGQIIQLHRPKDLTFIRYQNLDEAVDCYQAMQNHANFNVKPAKNKGITTNSENLRSRGNFENQQRNKDMNRRHNDGGEGRGRRSDENDFNFRAGGADLNQRTSDANTRPMPKLVPVASTPPEDGVNQVKPAAKEVVIGNLPPAMKQHNIYELCSKARATPLHVAMKKFNRETHPTIYYAYVYVKTEKDVKNIVDGLNNLKVNGSQLVVSSTDKLVEEGKSVF